MPAEDAARLALDRLPQGVCVWGPDRRVRLFNPAYLRLMEGAPVAVGDTLREVIRRRAEAGEYGPGDPGAIYAREMAHDPGTAQQRRRLRPNGTAIDIRSVPLPDGGHLSVVTDITPLWRAEQEARHRAELLETALGSVRHGIVIAGPDHRILAANHLARSLAGHDPGEVLEGRTVEEAIRQLHRAGRIGPEPQDRELVRTALALDRGKPHVYRHTNPAGQVVEVSSDPTPDGGFVITHVDITPLARAEDEARHRAGILQVMLDNIRHGICLFDGDGRVVAANALAARMCGLEPGQLAPGRHLYEIRDDQVAAGEFGPPEEAARFVALRPYRSWRGPDRYARRRPNGTTLEIITDPTPDGGFVRTYSDVTEDRQIREELEAARLAAEAASEAKSRFLATMSHELRTPLSAIIGFAEALVLAPDPERVVDYAATIREAGRDLLAVIDDILEVTRIGGGTDSPGGPVDLGRLLAELAVPAGEAEGPGLSAEAAADLPPLFCDGRRLRRLLRAVLDNAVKFTPADGRVRLSAVRAANGDIIVQVADTGIGMAEADIPRAFEPFTQLDSAHARRFGGSGLGLHLAKVLAQALGATIGLVSAPGQGTTVTLRLPARITISDQAATAPEDSP